MNPTLTDRAAHPDEIRLRQALALAHHDYSDLLCACRAAVAAESLGHPDPLFWVRDELARSCQLPTPGALPEQVAAVYQSHR